MLFRLLICTSLLLGQAATLAEEAGDEEKERVLGMSVVGNHEAPKALVIVPWKSSELGSGLQVSRAHEDGKGPVDKEEFLRQLSYYEIRSEDQDSM